MTAPGPGAHLLVAGGAGFIGSCFVRDVLARGDGTRVTVLDKLTYAGNRANLAPVEDDPATAARLAFVRGDIADPGVVGPLVAGADAVVNFAAESHVDRSILEPAAFLRTGVDGVHVLLEAVRTESERARAGRRASAPRLVQVSTDEVYGPVAAGRAVETDPLSPRSPYAAAKAAGELLVGAYHATYGIDAVLTRGANTYGPFQHPEKLVPLAITNALDDEPIPLYGDGEQRRAWLAVADHAAAVACVLARGVAGETYNVPGSAEQTNRDLLARILALLGRPWSLVRSVADRPGHDPRYAVDGSKLRALGWESHVLLDDGLAATVDWYREHEPWWRAARGPGWDAYYERQYGARLRDSVPAGDEPAGRRVSGPRAGRHPAGGRRIGGAMMRVAITGAGGRLGRALTSALAELPLVGPAGLLAWSRPDYDLDDPAAAGRLVGRDAPDVVVHAAGWTDVDGCARDPGRAMRRNATAVAELAEACVAGGAHLVLVSTNEVFDGLRADGHGYRAEDRPSPRNAYGASKLAGETAAQAAFLRAAGPRLVIVRTAWLFGPPGNDFPAKILAAAERARAAGSALRVVADEIGSPTYAPDLAAAIGSLVAAGAPEGIVHVVNMGAVSRAGWARAVLAAAGVSVPLEEVSVHAWTRPSLVPPWAVLAPTPLPSGGLLRSWEAAFADYVPLLVGGRRAGGAR